MMLILKIIMPSTPKAAALVKTLITFNEILGAHSSRVSLLPTLLVSSINPSRVPLKAQLRPRHKVCYSAINVPYIVAAIPKKGPILPALSLTARQHLPTHQPHCSMNTLGFCSYIPSTENTSHTPHPQSLSFKILPQCPDLA